MSAPQVGVATIAAAPERTGIGQFAAAVTFLLAVVHARAFQASFWAPKMAVVAVLGGAGFWLLVRKAHPSRRAATFAARAFLGVATVSMLVSEVPRLALVGMYNLGTGLIFVFALAGAWAVGSQLASADRALLRKSIIAGALVNVVVACAQMAFDLREFGYARVQGRAGALLGNPIFLTPLLVVALALLLPNLKARPARWWPAAAVLGLGLALSGGRAGLALGLALILVAAIQFGRIPALLVATALLAGAVIGPIVDRPPAASPASQSSSTEDEAPGEASSAGFDPSPDNRPLAPRLATWGSAWPALLERPLLGHGPGRFHAGTVRHRPLVVARDTPDAYFADAHNIVIEYAVTTGVLGILGLLGWLALSLRLARGPFALVAGLLLLHHLVQPQNVALTPLTFLAIGAAVAEGRGSAAIAPPTRGVLAGIVAGGAIALCFAAVFLVGEFWLRQGVLDFRRADAARADRLIGVWPRTAQLQARIAYYEHFDGDSTGRRRAVAWTRVALARDRFQPSLHNELGARARTAGDVESARRAFLGALELDRWSVRALVGMATVEVESNNPTAALRWINRALRVDPDDQQAIDLRNSLG